MRTRYASPLAYRCGPDNAPDGGDCCLVCRRRESQADGCGCGDLESCKACHKRLCRECLADNDGLCPKCDAEEAEARLEEEKDALLGGPDDFRDHYFTRSN